MVHSKDCRSWVNVLCVSLVLICTVSLSPNGATHVGTLSGTYPSRCGRSLSELSLFLNDSIFMENQNTNGNHYTYGNGPSGMNQEEHSHGEMQTNDNMAEGQNRKGSNEQQGNWANEQQSNWIDEMHLKWEAEVYRKLEEEENHGKSEEQQLDSSDGNLPDRSDGDLPDRSDGDLLDRSDGDLLDRSNGNLLDRSYEEKDKPYPQQRYGRYQQQSYEVYPKQYRGTVYPNWRNRILESYKSRLPYGCIPHDISWNLTDEQILNMPYPYLFWLSKRKAFILYFYNGIFLEREYYEMVDYLNKWFSNVAEANNLPHGYKVQWWEKCNKELLHDLECIQRTCEKFFRNFVGKRRSKYIWTMSFEYLIYRFRKITHKSVIRNKDKWIRILTERVKRYREKANKKHITHRDKR